MLAEVLELGRLENQLVDLLIHAELLVGFKITAGELLRNAVKHLNCSSVLYLGHFLRPVAIGHASGGCGRGVGTRTTPDTGKVTSHAIHASGLSCEKLGRSHGCVENRWPASACGLRANDGLFPFRVEVGPRGAGRIREAPCEQGIVDELEGVLVSQTHRQWCRVGKP